MTRKITAGAAQPVVLVDAETGEILGGDANPIAIVDLSPDGAFAVPGVDSGDNVDWGDVIGNKDDTAAGDSIVALIKASIAGDFSVPAPDAVANADWGDVIGNKTDVGSLAAGIASLVALARKGAKEAWEAEHHLHNVERWYGAGASKALKLASKTPFDLAGANDDWGAWTTLLVPTDTPAISGGTHFDLHRIVFEDVQAGASKKASRFQIAWDTAVDGEADAITNGTYTEWISSPEKDGKAQPNDIIMKRIAVGTCYVFMRYWCLDENLSGTDTKVFVGSHEYTDPDV